MSRVRVSWLIGALLWATASAAAPAPQPEPSRADAKLRSAIQERFLDDARVRASEVEIQVINGVVTLRGDVPTLAERAAAIKVASRVKGVQAVRNEVHIRPPRIADRLIQAAVLERIRTASDVTGSRTVVRVRNQVVTLEGTYPTLASMDRVVAAAGEVAGVRDIVVRTQVRPVVLRPDVQVRAAIASSLINDGGVDARTIRVGVRDGRAVLEGTVGSPAEWFRADEIVRNITGVRILQNRLRVAPPRPIPVG